MNYIKILEKLTKFKYKKYSTVKKFAVLYDEEPLIFNKVYYTNRLTKISTKIRTKYNNHLSRNSNIFNSARSKKYKTYYFERIKGHGIFKLTLVHYNNKFEEFDYRIIITRNKIIIEKDDLKFNLDDKCERFEALLHFNFNYSILVQMQVLMKKKPSGTYKVFYEN